MKMYRIPKINKSMGSIIAYVESEFGESKAHEFDRYICKEILDIYIKNLNIIVIIKFVNLQIMSF